MALESLPLRHSSVPDCFNTALAAIDPSLEACFKGIARFQDCDDACTAEQDDTTQQHHQKHDRDIAPEQFPGLDGSYVNWAVSPQIMAILGLSSA